MRRRHRWILGTSVAAVALLSVPFIPFPAGHVADVAARFQPEGATEHMRTVEPRHIPCRGGAPCPSVRAGWTFASAVQNAGLQRWLHDAHYPLTVDGRCADRDQTDHDLPTCSADGVVDGVHVSVSVSFDVTTGEGGVWLYAS